MTAAALLVLAAAVWSAGHRLADSFDRIGAAIRAIMED
jgi:hypothetical protein